MEQKFFMDLIYKILQKFINFLKSLKISKEIKNPAQFANQVVFKKNMTKVKKIKKIGECNFQKYYKRIK